MVKTQGERFMVIHSIVRCCNGYVAIGEYERPINFYPHYTTVVVKAKGLTIEEALCNVKAKEKIK
jgi:hypothetical protein